VNRYSIGSSTVTMWTSRVRLMRSIMAAMLVVLPWPVGPVTRMSPLCFCTRELQISAGRPSSSKVFGWCGIDRIAIPTALRCW
jgi:hypothetical protein